MLAFPNSFREQWLQRQKLPEKPEQRLVEKNKTFNLIAIKLQVIAAEGEKKASRALREASEIISESPAALQLRYLQVILKTTIFVGKKIPLRIMRPIFKNKTQMQFSKIKVKEKFMKILRQISFSSN